MVVGNLLKTRYQEIFIGTLIKQEKDDKTSKLNNDIININRIKKPETSICIEQDMVRLFLALMDKTD